MVIRVPLADEAVDVSVVAWNSWPHLQRSLPAMIRQDYPAYRVIVVDNASQDETAEAVESHFPGVAVIRSARNEGYGAGNNRCFERSASRYVAVLNPDAEPEPGWLRALVRALEEAPQAAFATSKVLLAHDPGRVNACGTRVHLTGIASCRALGDDQHDHVAPVSVPGVSGAAFLARRDALEQIGGFDERFFMYMEDVELSLRARLAGWDIVLAPRSRVAHDYTPDIPPWKFYYLERNRILMLLKLLRWRTLALLAPALLVAEVGVWLYALRASGGLATAKARSYAGVLRHLPGVLRSRGRVRAIRRAPDRDLLDIFEAALPQAPGAGRPTLIRCANAFFSGYARMLRHAVRW